MKFIRYSAAIVLMFIFCHGALAQRSDFTFGVKAGQNDIDSVTDISGAGVVFSSGSTLGFSLGYHVSKSLNMELEFIQGSFKVSGPGGSAEPDLDSTAFYAAYRSQGKVYFMGKLGIVSEKVKFAGVSNGYSGFGAGVGAGYRFGEIFSLEAEYTSIDTNANLMALVARFTF